MKRAIQMMGGAIEPLSIRAVPFYLSQPSDVFARGVMHMPEDVADLIARGTRARREQRLNDAYAAYQEAAELSRSAGLEQHLVSALVGLGQIQRDRGYLDHAQQHYADALALCRHHGDPLAIAHTARHLGDIYRENGHTEQARTLLAEAITVYRQNLDTKVLDLANAIRPFALLMIEMGDVDAARPLLQEALVLYSALDLTGGVAECSTQLAKLVTS